MQFITNDAAHDHENVRGYLIFLLILRFFLFYPSFQPAYADQAEENVSAAPNEEKENAKFLRLEKELKARYRRAILNSNKPISREERAKRIRNGWDLFSDDCRICHGFSEKAGQRSEIELNPSLNDGGRLSRTLSQFLRFIYFGGGLMPSFGLGAFEGEIVASEAGYVKASKAKRLTPEEAMDIAFYLRFCYQVQGTPQWYRQNGKSVLDLEKLK